MSGPIGNASRIGVCARCDKPFEPGERVCVVAFGHLEFHLGAEDETARISDRTVLCLACEDLISDAWPFLPAELAQAIADRDAAWASRNQLRRELVAAKDENARLAKERAR